MRISQSWGNCHLLRPTPRLLSITLMAGKDCPLSLLTRPKRLEVNSFALCAQGQRQPPLSLRKDFSALFLFWSLVSKPFPAGRSLSDRVRITYEARQLLLNCNSPGEPTGLCYTCLIVTSGPHCCLPNISEEGKWLCDETFQWRGATVSHKKGAFVGSLMEPWRALRAKNSTSSGTSL